MQWFAKKRHGINALSLSNHIGIETGNRKESESISRIEIDKIQMIPNPKYDRVRVITPNLTHLLPIHTCDLVTLTSHMTRGEDNG